MDSQVNTQRKSLHTRKKTIKNNQISPFKSYHSIKMQNTMRSIPFIQSKKSFLARTKRKVNFKLPKRWFMKILYLLIIIPIIPLKLTLPKYKRRRTLAKYYFGLLLSLIYILFLNFVCYIIIDIFKTFWVNNQYIWAYLINLQNISFVYYCFESPIINSYYFNSVVQEISLFDLCFINLLYLILSFLGTPM